MNRAVVGGVPVPVDHLIGGEWVAGSATFETRTPLDWDTVLADVARGDGAASDAAVTAAKSGFAVWGSM
ncbi:MAG: betaine-aldehyde dehydrogenase, partial [Acidimicrobiales bacterium]